MSGTPRTQTKTKTNLTHQPCCDDEFPPSPPTPLPQKPEPTNPFIFATGELGEEAMTDEDSGRHLPTYCGWVSPPKPGLPTNKITKHYYAVKLYKQQGFAADRQFKLRTAAGAGSKANGVLQSPGRVWSKPLAML